MDRVLHLIKKLIPNKLFSLAQPAYHFFINWLGAVIYKRPSEKLVVIGITGTTGKTTTVFLAAKMLANAGYKVGYTSTAMFSDGEKEWQNEKKMTMIGRFFTQSMISRMVKNGCQYAIIETTSEGIRQFRHKFINYDLALFTCLYPEHIESHGSFENYKQAKGRLFSHLTTGRVKYIDESRKVASKESGLAKIDHERVKKTIIANGDDEHAGFFLGFPAERKIVYSRKPGRFEGETLEYGRIKTDSASTSFEALGLRIRLNLPGEFSAANAMAAASIGHALGLEPDMIKKGLESIKGIPGRLEKIDEGQDFTVLVDYAFEPNAVEKLYEVVGMIRPEDSRIIHVIGSAGGGRDVARRPKLGRIAGEKADIVIVTNEDPYDEDPAIIIDQVSLGAEKAGKKEGRDLFKVEDREKAIAKAFDLAGTGDIVLITGKGNEQAICVSGGRKIPWDDRKTARKLLKNKQ